MGMIVRAMAGANVRRRFVLLRIGHKLRFAARAAEQHLLAFMGKSMRRLRGHNHAADRVGQSRVIRILVEIGVSATLHVLSLPASIACDFPFSTTWPSRRNHESLG
jgi:hypothetical protein